LARLGSSAFNVCCLIHVNFLHLQTSAVLNVRRAAPHLIDATNVDLGIRALTVMKVGDLEFLSYVVNPDSHQ
jgi:hypothetical protein